MLDPFFTFTKNLQFQFWKINWNCLIPVPHINWTRNLVWSPIFLNILVSVPNLLVKPQFQLLLLFKNRYILVLVPIWPQINRLKNSVLCLVHKILKNLILKNLDLVPSNWNQKFILPKWVLTQQWIIGLVLVDIRFRYVQV
jgi:hypothetical protein